MAEDENNEQSAADALTDEETGGESTKLRLLIPVGVVVLSAAAGFLVTRLTGDSAPSQASGQGDFWESAQSDDGSGNYEYYPLDPIIVNLNEPGLARYIRATLTLVIRAEYKDAIKTIEKTLSTIRSRLILYLSNCSLEEVRGAENLNRILRDIQDSLNDWLWPNGRPLIVRVDYSEWAIQ